MDVLSWDDILKFDWAIKFEPCKVPSHFSSCKQPMMHSYSWWLHPGVNLFQGLNIFYFNIRYLPMLYTATEVL